MKKINAVVYSPRLNQIYCIAELDDCGFATYTDHPIYPLHWWTWEEFDKLFTNSVYLGEL